MLLAFGSQNQPYYKEPVQHISQECKQIHKKTAYNYINVWLVGSCHQLFILGTKQFWAMSDTVFCKVKKFRKNQPRDSRKQFQSRCCICICSSLNVINLISLIFISKLISNSLMVLLWISLHYFPNKYMGGSWVRITLQEAHFSQVVVWQTWCCITK